MATLKMFTKIPVRIASGRIGSGKARLIQALLHQNERPAVITMDTGLARLDTPGKARRAQVVVALLVAAGGHCVFRFAGSRGAGAVERFVAWAKGRQHVAHPHYNTYYP